MKVIYYYILLLLYNIYFHNNKYSILYTSNNKIIHNFECISKSNEIFLLKYIFKIININYKKRVKKMSFIRFKNSTKYLNEFNSLLPELKPKIKIYYFKNVVVSRSGSIHTSNYNLRLGRGCKCNNLDKIKYGNIKNYQKVIVLSQYWSYATFHSLIECLTKISFVLSYVLSHNILIHIEKNKALYNYLNILGVKYNQTVNGNIYTNYAYVIENSLCGKSSGILPLMFLKSRLIKRNKFFNNIQNTILIIKRLYSRSIYNFMEFLLLLKSIFQNYTIEIFYPNTSFNDTLYMFSTAIYIFAPHGAGLSNIILCHANIKVIEFLTYLNPNLCYASLSYSLEYKYYGIVQYFNGWQFVINLTYLNNFIRKYKLR